MFGYPLMRCSLSFSALLCGEQNRSILTAQIISRKFCRRQRQTVQPLLFFYYFIHDVAYFEYSFLHKKKGTPRLSYRHHVSNHGRKPSLQATAHGRNSTTPPPRPRTRAYLQTSTRSHLLGGQKTPQSIALTTCRLCKFSHVII